MIYIIKRVKPDFEGMFEMARMSREETAQTRARIVKVAAAISHAVSTSMAELDEAESRELKTVALERYIDHYLSDEHVENPRDGCPLAALGPEAPRSSTRISNALDDGSVEAVRVLTA